MLSIHYWARYHPRKHVWLVDLPGITLKKKKLTLSPRSHQPLVASQLRAGATKPIPTPCLKFYWLDPVPPAITAGHQWVPWSDHIWKTHFALILSNLWLLWSFCHLFLDDPWALGRNVIWMFCLWMSTLHCILTRSKFLHYHPLHETSLMNRKNFTKQGVKR